jgi:FtsP/CotA-like multicopper oxidase with cupredoxin domain
VDGTVADGLLDLGQPHEDRLRRAMIGREDSRRPVMRAIAVTKSRILLVLAVIAAGLMLSGSAASAATVSINLCAVPGNATLTGAVTVPIWGFGIPTTPGDCTTATASLPGPQLDLTLSATETTTVTFNVTNALPAGHSITFEIPGITFDAGPADAPPGATLIRSFTAPASPSAPGAVNAAGTYLYESGGDGGRQEAMGLYGALIVRPSTAGRAYESAASAYDVEAPLVLSAVDPAFNNAADPMAFDMYTYRATYWLINGKAYPDTAPGITATAGQRVLLRYLNAGFDNTAMALLGMHEHVVAKDARLLNTAYDASADTMAAGATEDAIATIPAGTPPSTNGFALYNRQLHLTNGAQTGTSPTPGTGGGMLTFIHP